VLGGNLLESALPRLALERGGHLRVGLEDYTGDASVTNEELVAQAVDVVARTGRPIASPAETSEMLGLRPAVPAST
jgi:uncharacterized protein (DUF849 family)